VLFHYLTLARQPGIQDDNHVRHYLPAIKWLIEHLFSWGGVERDGKGGSLKRYQWILYKLWIENTLHFLLPINQLYLRCHWMVRKWAFQDKKHPILPLSTTKCIEKKILLKHFSLLFYLLLLVLQGFSNT